MSGDTAEPKAGLRSYALSTLSIAVILIAWESVARDPIEADSQIDR